MKVGEADDFTVKVSEDHPLIKKKIKKALKESVVEGSVSSLSGGFGVSYLSAFALFLNATASQVGALYAMASLLPSIVQLKSSKLLERFTRKKITLFSFATRLVLWIPIILTGVLFYMGYPHTIFLFLLFATLFYGFSAISAPAWFSWIGSLVKEDDRGRYFSKRNRAIGFSSIISLILAAFILDYSKKIGIQRGDVLLYTLIGFGILFILAMITRFISFVLLSRQYEPKIKIRKEDECPFLPFLKNSYKNDFGRFTIFKFFLSFAVAIIGPFWIVYMLQNLGFSYFWFISTVISHMLFQIIFLPYLGKFSDKFGNVKLMKISVYFIASIPFLWFLSSLIENQILLKVYLLTIPSIVAGVSWGGYNLATNNYLYDAISQKKRGFELPHVNFMVGIGMFLGAGAGSLIVLLDIAFMEILLFIMILSGVLRLLVLIFGLKYLKEVKNVGDFSSEYVLNELNPIEGHGLEMKGTNLKKHKVEHYI